MIPFALCVDRYTTSSESEKDKYYILRYSWKSFDVQNENYQQMLPAIFLWRVELEIINAFISLLIVNYVSDRWAGGEYIMSF